MQNADSRTQNERPAESEQQNSVFYVLCSAFCILAVLAIGHFGFGPLLVPAPVAGAETGRPVAGVPAPPRATLLGRLGGDGPNAALTYASRADADSVAQFYRREMPRRGWKALDIPADISQTEGPVLAYSNRAGVSCIIAVSRMDSGGSAACRVTIVRAAPGDQRMN